MERIFHLAYHLDTNGYDRVNLISFSSLSELDKYIMENFIDAKEVRKTFEQDICELVIDRIDFLKRENKRNKRNWMGSISIICEEKERNKTIIYKIPIIYKKDNRLLPVKECLKKIKEMLNNDSVIDEILERKAYLLSQNEKKLLQLYKEYSLDKYKKMFMNDFYNRIKGYDEETLYYYLRCLMNIFRLNKKEIKTKYGTVDNISTEIPLDTVLKEEPLMANDSAPEYFIHVFNEAVKTEDYDTLFTEFTAEEINSYSNFYKKRRK